MKRLPKLRILVALSCFLLLSSCFGEYYVADQPAEIVYVRPVVPYTGAVWIGGDWIWSGGRYVHSRGHWARPRAGHAYVRGNWAHNSRGYSWHKGHWQ